MSQYLYQISGHRVQLYDLTPELNEQFQSFLETHFATGSLNWKEFRAASFDYFDQNSKIYGAHDYYFNNFTPVWKHFITQSDFKRAEEIWRIALKIAAEWEKKTADEIHKGTPYYFWGMNAILNNEIEKGFLLMHNALEEDKESRGKHNPSTPARHFTHLNPSQESQAFYDKVNSISNFLRYYLEAYRDQRGMDLTFSDFRSLFLEEPDLQETGFSFIYNLFRLEMLVSRMRQIPRTNAFASVHQADVFFSFCRVLENILSYQLEDTVGAEASMGNYLDNLSSNHGLSLHFNDRLTAQINRDRQNGFQNTVSDLLQRDYNFEDGSAPSSIETDLCLAYCIRNFGAHSIDDYSIIYKRVDDIAQRILYTLFFSIEKLYP